MKEFYDLIQKIYEELNSNRFINTVTMGNIMDVDLSKQSIFPLAHINIQNATFSDHVITFAMQVIAMDIVDESKSDRFNPEESEFITFTPPLPIDLDNKQDVLNTQLAVINRLQSKLRRGDLNDDNYVLDADATATMFEDRFENLLAGWALDLTISVPNNVVTVCGN